MLTKGSFFVSCIDAMDPNDTAIEALEEEMLEACGGDGTYLSKTGHVHRRFTCGDCGDICPETNTSEDIWFVYAGMDVWLEEGEVYLWPY